MGNLHVVLALVFDPVFGTKGQDAVGPTDKTYVERVANAALASLEMREAICKETGISYSFTWLVRVDEYIVAHYGEAACFLRQLHKVWRTVEKFGDELGWVFYPVENAKGEWVQPFADEKQLSTLITKNYEAYSQVWKPPVTLLAGCHSHTQTTMKLMSALGIRVDLSAIPGWLTIPPQGSQLNKGQSDWEITPRTPYHPSSTDYRRPIVYQSESPLDILEIPWTLQPLPKRRVLKEALLDLWRPQSLGLLRNYRRRRQGLPVQINVQKSKFKNSITNFLNSIGDRNSQLVILCQATVGQTVYNNLRWFASECQLRGLDLESRTASGVRELFEGVKPVGMMAIGARR